MINSVLQEKTSRAVGEFHELIELGLINEGGEFISTRWAACPTPEQAIGAR
ncbi:MAG: hypothetical protein HY796_13605 [Elusimicrobia bacterium]|nr:hypothetical protein [Elusimicrobiota bacterium]